MKKLRLTKQALDFLTQLDGKRYRQVGRAVFRLLADVERADSEALKAHGEHRVDVGEYRIIYIPGDQEVEELIIGKRNDDEVYRMWKRK